ncbi:hypothetical protein RB213_001694 [Colletotrichum asianum]
MATGERLQKFDMSIDDFTTRLKVQTVGVRYKVLVFSLRHSSQLLQMPQGCNRDTNSPSNLEYRLLME